MYSIHWPKFSYEKAEKPPERPLNTFEKEDRHIKVDYAVIAVLYVAVLLIVWSSVML